MPSVHDPVRYIAAKIPWGRGGEGREGGTTNKVQQIETLKEKRCLKPHSRRCFSFPPLSHRSSPPFTVSHPPLAEQADLQLWAFEHVKTAAVNHQCKFIYIIIIYYQVLTIALNERQSHALHLPASSSCWTPFLMPAYMLSSPAVARRTAMYVLKPVDFLISWSSS